MEDGHELRAKSAASMPTTAIPNSEADNNCSKSKEEGELSSSGDDGFPAASQFNSTAPRPVPVRAASLKKNSRSLEAGTTISTVNPASAVDITSKTTVQRNYGKSAGKNRGPFVPFLIGFSDDDSGSDSEEYRLGKALKITGNSIGVDDRTSPLPSLMEKSQILRPTTRNETKVIPKKVSSSHTFVSSMAKTNRATSSNSTPSLVGQRSRLRTFNTLNRKSAGRGHGGDQSMHLNSSKLQDLRQQIAIQEKKLKLKSAQQNKEMFSARKCEGTSSDFVRFEPKEPDKKRVKVGEPHSSPSISEDQQELPVITSALASQKSVLESCAQQNINDHRCRDKEVLLGTMHSNIPQWPKKDVDRGHVSSANLSKGVQDGTDVITNRSRCDRNTKLVEPYTLSQQIACLRAEGLECPNGLSYHHTSSSVPNKATREQNLTGSCQFHEIRSDDKTDKPTLDDTPLARSLHVADNNLETSDASLNNASLWDCLGKVNISGNSNMDIQSLLEFEELLDKELEEAQEYRHKCEVEERTALKAYRKAQRALSEANARCSYLYQKRELYSADFRSLMVADSSLFWSSRLHNHVGSGLNFSNKMSEVNVHLAPTSSHQMQAESNVRNLSDSNIHSAKGLLQNGSGWHADGQNLAANPCIDPDASTSEPHKDDGVTNGVCSPCNDLEISGDESEDTFPFDHRSVQSNPDCQLEEIYEESVDMNEVSKRRSSFDNSQDSLLLEATLRSQLFERLGIKTLSEKTGLTHSMKCAVGKEIEDDDGGEKMEMSMGIMPCSEEEKDRHFDLGDVHQSRISLMPASPILRSAFGPMKAKALSGLNVLQAGNQLIHSYDIYNGKGNGVGSDEAQPRILSVNLMEDTSIDKCFKNDGSYSCNLAIDPFWPLCMYELRGKCNNDKCSWQHVKDYANINMNHDKSDSADCQVGLSSNRGNYGAANLSKCINCLVLAPPTYTVCLDILKADLHSYRSVLDRCIGQCWIKCFSFYLVLSNLLPTDLASDERLLHGSEARIEVHGTWNKQSLYFRTRNGTLSQSGQYVVDNDQSLEMALLTLNQEVNKKRGKSEALKVLGRAVVADPTSAAIWIVYLHIYYSNAKPIGKDDLFYHAVEKNKGSYELWLMYINSRMQLSDRLVAYDNALSALSRHASSSDRDPLHVSACILDIFLQMMNCFCISGNIGKAAEKTYGLFPTTKSSDNPGPLLLSDILPCLTISDKCIFWICCVYVAIYRKLPNAILELFECEKELSALEWPFTRLTTDEKQHAVTLMEMAVDFLALHIDGESLKSETTLKAAHLFAVNHIRCITVLEGLECGRNLLDKYTKLYPSCLELVLMSARAHDHDFGDLSFVGFEEALINWPEEVPGVQCIWNQYAECALQNGRFDFAKELLDRWFHSVWEVQYSQNQLLNTMYGENFLSTPESAEASDPHSWISNSNQIDILFALLNFCLYKLLNDNRFESRKAIDRALKAAAIAGPEYYKHCVREHAAFLLMDGSQGKMDAPRSGILKIVKSYLVDARVFHASEPLSRMFIQSTKKPVQHLISKIWSPVSSDFSLLNLVLESWYGPSLLPQGSSNLKQLVDLVEAIMDIMPSNYQLAISVCKLLNRGSNSSDVASTGISFWASSLLVNSLFQAVPVAPEFVWVEAAYILRSLIDIQSITEGFHKRALSVFPFSIMLWKSYLDLSRATGNMNAVIEAAREVGIELDCDLK
ncbi:uncharacterized protein LOC132312029 [Cornus florida]|uniref:uncharacterized protein LOC132312029 n=1 Tax=Cornus florida TaxID=4283 RepID=UPI0028974C0E|nr:uncharacterized protein LOC132312029 [Cornus florida]